MRVAAARSARPVTAGSACREVAERYVAVGPRLLRAARARARRRCRAGSRRCRRRSTCRARTARGCWISPRPGVSGPTSMPSAPSTAIPVSARRCGPAGTGRACSASLAALGLPARRPRALARSGPGGRAPPGAAARPAAAARTGSPVCAQLRATLDDQPGPARSARRSRWPRTRRRPTSPARTSSCRPRAPGAAVGSAVMKRSYISVVTATDQPPSISPTSRSASTRAPVKKTSLKPCGAVHLMQRPDLDAGLVDVDDEVAQALVLGHLAVGAGQQHAPVGALGARGPHLLAVDRPARPPSRTARVCALARSEPGARLGEELAPGLLAAGQGGRKRAFCSSLACIEQDRAAEQLAQARPAAPAPRTSGRPPARRPPRRRAGPARTSPRASCGKPQPESASRAHQARTVSSGSQLARSQLSAILPGRLVGVRRSCSAGISAALRRRGLVADPRISF